MALRGLTIGLLTQLTPIGKQIDKGCSHSEFLHLKNKVKLYFVNCSSSTKNFLDNATILISDHFLLLKKNAGACSY